MRKYLIVILLLAASFQSSARVSTPEQIKTLFVFNFLKYMKWENIQDEYRIAYVGSEDKLYQEFKAMADQKSIAGKKITIELIQNASNATGFHMVYIPEHNAEKLRSFSSLNHTVVVTEKKGLALKGSHINFITQSGKIRFEVNKERFTESNVKISTQLLNLAIVV